MGILINVALFLTAMFLIVLILLQRGRGGGLAGALGGMGGQSAFGAKAGDTFTKITTVVAIFWILLCVGAVKYYASSGSLFSQGLGGAAQTDADREASKASPEDRKSGTAAPGDESRSAGDQKPNAAKSGRAQPAGAAKKSGGSGSKKTDGSGK